MNLQRNQKQKYKNNSINQSSPKLANLMHTDLPRQKNIIKTTTSKILYVTNFINGTAGDNNALISFGDSYRTAVFYGQIQHTMMQQHENNASLYNTHFLS
jgi:hypothetical protein